MVELKKILAGLIVVNCLLSQVTLASEVEKEHKIYMDISKTGLNKISNPPYKITDVIGDSSTFEIQSKMDGEYIYLTPKVRVDEHIEISIKNNIGKLIEFVFKVTDITSQTITVDDKKIEGDDFSFLKEKISSMLLAMINEQEDGFFIKKINEPVIGFEPPVIKMIEAYKWGKLTGVRFEVWNTRSDRRIPVEKKISVEEAFYSKKWRNLLVYWGSAKQLEPEEKATVIAIFREPKDIR